MIYVVRTSSGGYLLIGMVGGLSVSTPNPLTETRAVEYARDLAPLVAAERTEIHTSNVEPRDRVVQALRGAR